jgi:hypothetical protein
METFDKNRRAMDRSSSVSACMEAGDVNHKFLLISRWGYSGNMISPL